MILYLFLRLKIKMRSNVFKCTLNLLFLVQAVSLIEMFRLIIYQHFNDTLFNAVQYELQYIYDMWYNICHAFYMHIINIIVYIKIIPVFCAIVFALFAIMIIIKYKNHTFDCSTNFGKNLREFCMFYIAFFYIIFYIRVGIKAKSEQGYVIETTTIISFMFIIAACITEILSHNANLPRFAATVLKSKPVKLIIISFLLHYCIRNMMHVTFTINSFIFGNMSIIYFYIPVFIFHYNGKIHIDYVLILIVGPLTTLSTVIRSLSIVYITIETFIEYTK